MDTIDIRMLKSEALSQNWTGVIKPYHSSLIAHKFMADEVPSQV